jgi:glycosyltransferase involved in cell wall biosynthesis
LTAPGASDEGRPLRFCLLSTFYPPWNFGGDGIQVERLAHALADRGHRVTVVCSPAVHRILSRKRAAPPHEHPGVEVVALRDNLISLTGTYLAGRPLRARRQLEAVLARGFDVIHFHNPSLLGAPALLEMGEGVKLYTAHEQWLLCPSHVLWKRGGRVCERPRCRSCELQHLRPPQLWRRTSLLERSLPHLDALIAPSRTSADLHRRFAALTRIEVIDHFVPRPPEGAGGPLATPAPGERAGRPYFLYVGRLEPIKGVGGLIEVFRHRRDQDLVIAGEGGLRRRLKLAAAGLPHVRFAGWVAAQELDPLYRGALAIVLPTRGHEAFALVAVEAMARGVPVIAHRFGAQAEIVEETGAGLTYGTPAELDAALGRLASEPGLRDALGRRGLEAARGRYSVDAHLRSYLSLIASLAARRGAGELAGAARR